MSDMETPVPQFELHDRLAKARRFAGIERTAMATAHGVTLATLTRWENGHVVPRTGVVALYSHMCGVPISWFLSDTIDRHEVW